MRAFQTAVIASCVSWALGLAAPAAAEVQLSIRDGRVSIVAKDATLRQILTEWARVGRTKIVNVERIPGGPLTLELTNVPETEALDVLLRSLSGYMAAPRIPFATDASQFDAIVVMPTTAAPSTRSAASVAPTPFAPPPGFPPVEDDDGPRPGGPGQGPRGPIFTTFPQPQISAPQQQRPNLPAVRPGLAPPNDQGQPVQQPIALPQPATPAAQPSSPFGAVSTPGMIAPAPASQPGQIAQPRRPNDN
jgi:hypothetical protein